MNNEETEIVYPQNKAEWRQWLIENHESKQSVWFIYNKKKSNLPVISWSEAVDEALCFGWIDSTAKPIDDKTYKQFFSKRKPKSVWSKVNKSKIACLIEAGLMTSAGFLVIEKAKKDGSWSILDEVEELVIPLDLENEFILHPNSKIFFLNLSKSIRKAILQWLVLAKREETRKKRILEIVESASKNQKPKQFISTKNDSK